MQQKQLPKSFFATVASISLAAFLFVNIHAALTLPASLTRSDLQTASIGSEENKDTKLNAPGFSVATHLFALAKRLLGTTNVE